MTDEAPPPPSEFPPIGPAIAESIRMTVEGQVFTAIVRHHWTEGNHGLALELLNCIKGISLENALAVINGTKGFVGNSGAGWTLVDT